MHRYLIPAIAAFGLAANIASAETIVLEPSVSTEIRSYVVEERKATPVTFTETVEVEKTIVPADVTLLDVEDDSIIVKKAPKLKGHKYFYTGDKVVFVEPESRKVVYVIEK